MPEGVWWDCFAQASLGRDKDFEGAATNPRVFTRMGWGGVPEGRAGGSGDTEDRACFCSFQPRFVTYCWVPEPCGGAEDP